MKSSSLERLFPDVGRDRFLDAHYLREHLVQHGDPSRLPAFLRGPDGALSNFDRARTLGASFEVGYTHQGGYAQRRGEGDVETLYDLGATIRFDALEQRSPDARRWLADLCAELGMPDRNAEGCDATLNGWASQRSKGIAWHYDTQETILIQLVGQKRFKVAANAHARFPDVPYQTNKGVSLDMFPVFPGGFPEGPPAECVEVELGPGSVIYMPRGLWHASESLSPDSFAIAVVLRAPTTLDVYLSHLRERLRGDPAWQRPVQIHPRGPRRRAELDRLDALLRALPHELAATRARDVFHHASITGRERLDAKSPYALQVSPTMRLTCTERDGALLVEVDAFAPSATVASNTSKHIEAAFEVAAACAPVFAWLEARRSVFTLDDLCTALPSLDRGDIVAIVRQLIEFSVVVVMPFAPRTVA